MSYQSEDLSKSCQDVGGIRSIMAALGHTGFNQPEVKRDGVVFSCCREAEFSWPMFSPARLSLGVCSGQLAQNLVTDTFTKRSIFSVLPQNAGAA